MSPRSPLIRVLVVDDSAFARKVMREVLSAHADIEVVGIAHDGLEALEKVVELRPDVVTLDLVMPNLDGVGFLEALPATGAPAVVVVSTSDANSDMGLLALERGAVDLVHKPTSLATDHLYELSDELVSKVRVAALARPARGLRAAVPAASVGPAQAEPRVGARWVPRLVAVGTSTGGPQALTRLLSALPGDLPVPIAVVLHIPGEYTAALARRLDSVCALHVVEASEGLRLEPGLAVVARGGLHLKFRRQSGQVVATLDGSPISTPHRPSVDVMLTSAVEVFGGGVLGVVLTGMGNDGLAGAQAVYAAGGRMLTESESSCVVYGMPRCVYEAGLADAEAPLDRMAAAILARF
ncbi:MAG TPA: chemotaxis-specific protein-glutamate methyltransferase CheB [Polyangia bacterium]|nr:chemotaxis-specific protein-glutamate methyltransferase CheB [Polyangia bacterium]